MSKTTRFEAALLAIRTHARTSVSGALNSITAAFTTEANGFAHEFHGTDQLTVARSHTLRSGIHARLSKLGARLITITTDALTQITDDTASQLTDAHVKAADDEDVTVDGLEGRFDGAFTSVMDRLQRASGRSVALPVLVSSYIKEARDAADAFLDRAVLAHVSEAVVADNLASLLRGQDIQYSFYDLARPLVTPLRSLESSGDLIAMSESFNVMRDATVAGLDAGGFVQAAPWVLSPRHSVVDICDTLASAKSEWGSGYYLLSNWPNAPHPRCGCGIGTPLIFFPASQW